MIVATARVHTQNGSRYLQQLCKHFAHKVDVTFAESHGEIRFSCGTAVLDADGSGLHIKVNAEDAPRNAETQNVVESHLLRFAFREELKPLVWQS